MSEDLFWNIFTRSGDPEAYMAYRRHSPARRGPLRPNPGGAPDGGGAA